MSHVSEGTLLAIRDGELVSTDHRIHLESCGQCMNAMASARARSTQIEEALAGVSTPVDLAAAKEAVRARMDARRAVERPRGRAYGHLGRAAAILLLGAGAAWALPGSPVRDWLQPSAPAVEHGAVAATEPTIAVEASGIEVRTTDAFSVILTDVEAGIPIEIILLEGAVSRITAPAGSTYSFADERIEASLTEGPVRIEIPRSLTTVLIRVNGVAVMEGSAANPTLRGVVELDGDRTVIAAPASAR